MRVNGANQGAFVSVRLELWQRTGLTRVDEFGAVPADANLVDFHRFRHSSQSQRRNTG